MKEFSKGYLRVSIFYFIFLGHEHRASTDFNDSSPVGWWFYGIPSGKHGDFPSFLVNVYQRVTLVNILGIMNHHPRTGNPYKPTSISWNDRGILNTKLLAPRLNSQVSFFDQRWGLVVQWSFPNGKLLLALGKDFWTMNLVCYLCRLGNVPT